MKIRAYQDIKPILGRDVYVDETATVSEEEK